MVALFTAAIAAALAGSIGLAVLTAAWLAVKGAKSRAMAHAWLVERGIDQAIASALRPVLTELWEQAWDVGDASAGTFTGAASGATWDFELYGRQWLNQIVQTRIDGLARLLADGPQDAAQLQAVLGSYLSSDDSAALVAMTEVTRAVGAAAAANYRAAGVWEVRWQTEDDTSVCPQCLANEQAGSRQLGTPFPSGAVAPPQHPRCRCALLPA